MISFIAALIIVYVLICLLLFAFQRQMIYFPVPEVNTSGVPYIVLDTGEVRIKVWTLNPGKENALIYFGGNAENVAFNIDSFKTLFADRTVYLVNYRGYGGSSGSPHEAGLYSDALLVYDHFSKQHSAVSAMGRSIGSAVATYLASERDIEKLILITPFDSAVNIAKKLYGFFPIDLILKEQLDAAQKAQEIRAKTLIIAADNDEIIPYENTQNLYKSFCKADVEFTFLSDTGHNNVHLHSEYEKTIRDFMRE